MVFVFHHLLVVYVLVPLLDVQIAMKSVKEKMEAKSQVTATLEVVQKKCLNYDDLCSKMHLFEAIFLDFQIQQLTIFKPVEVGKSYVAQKKALNRAV